MINERELPDDLNELAERIDYLRDLYFSGTLLNKERTQVRALFIEAAVKYNKIAGRKVFSIIPSK